MHTLSAIVFNPVLCAFLCGAGSMVILQATTDYRRQQQKNRRPTPTDRVRMPDPRQEARAILEICNWDFAQAFDWAYTIMGEDHPNADYWLRVKECIEIFQAGRQDIAA